jgi:hypothetical protein
MAHKNRKRANEKKVQKKEEKKEDLAIKAVGDNTLELQPDHVMGNLMKNYPVRTLATGDVNRFKELVTLSNNVSGLLKQVADAKLSIVKGKEVAKDMLDGKIKAPALQKVTQNLFLPLSDMKEVGRKISGEIKLIEQATIISKSQLDQRYEEYVDCTRNMNRLFEDILAKAPKQKLSKIRGDRAASVESKSEESVIFEKEFDKLTKKDTEFLKEITKTKKDVDESKKSDKNQDEK